MSQARRDTDDSRGTGPELMRLRYAGVCECCGSKLPAGTSAWYDRSRKKVRCQTCPHGGAVPVPEPAVALVGGTAGASAAREYQRRSQRRHERVEAAIKADALWRAEVKKDHPILGRVALALTPKPTEGPEPQSISAWRQGADGERKVGQHLDAWAASSGGLVLHDRRVPGTKANIDHIAINAAGVWVVDAKEYKGMVSISGSILSGPCLRVGGRERTRLTDGVLWQMERVAAALDAAAAGEPSPSVRGVLCFVGADWPLLRVPASINGVSVAWPAAVVKMLSQKGAGNDPAALDRWARALAEALPPA